MTFLNPVLSRVLRRVATAAVSIGARALFLSIQILARKAQSAVCSLPWRLLGEHSRTSNRLAGSNTRKLIRALIRLEQRMFSLECRLTLASTVNWQQSEWRLWLMLPPATRLTLLFLASRKTNCRISRLATHRRRLRLAPKWLCKVRRRARVVCATTATIGLLLCCLLLLLLLGKLGLL